MEKLLEILETNPRLSNREIAVMLGKTEEEVEAQIRLYEETGIILEPSSYVKSLDSYTIKFTNNKLEEVEKKVYPLLFKIMKKEVPKIKEPRILETNFISIEEFVNQCSYDNVKNIILSLMNDI